MRITPAATAIVLLVASNLVTGYLAIQRRGYIHADHLQVVRLSTEGNGTLEVTLGASDTPGGPVAINPHHAGTLVLTPRAAIQTHVELGRVIKDVQAAAAARNGLGVSPGEISGSPRPL